MKVTNGHTVAVHYRGTLPDEDNVEFDSSYKRGDPVEFEVGAGRMIEGFNNALLGMSIGETKHVSLAPEQSYGEPDKNAVQLVPKDALGEGFEFILPADQLFWPW